MILIVVCVLCVVIVVVSVSVCVGYCVCVMMMLLGIECVRMCVDELCYELWCFVMCEWFGCVIGGEVCVVW